MTKKLNTTGHCMAFDNELNPYRIHGIGAITCKKHLRGPKMTNVKQLKGELHTHTMCGDIHSGVTVHI